MTRVFSSPSADSVNWAHGRHLISEGDSIQSILLGGDDNLKEFLAGIPAVAYQCDQSLSVTRISPNASELLGVASAKLLGRPDLWGDRLHPLDRMSLVSRVEQLQPGQLASVIHRIVSEHGLPIWVAHSFRKTRTSRAESICGCLIPLTTELCTQNINSAIISQFVHKIGNHFQLINLIVGTLRRSEVAVGEVDALQQAVDRTVEFTRKFMSFTQSPTCPTDLELDEILKAAMQSSQPAFDDKRVRFVNCLDDCFSGVLVHGDPFLIEVAFGSIFQNALDATHSGDEVRVTGKCECHQSAPRMTAQIVIADTGCGMQIDNLRHADEPFFTSWRDRDGLGLSMAVRFIEQHGGTLQIASTERQGTQVIITLPVSESRLIPNH